MTDINLSLLQARKLARKFRLHDARELDAVAWEAHERALREFDPARCKIDPTHGLGSFVSFRVKFALFGELEARGIIPHPRHRHTRLPKERLTLHIEDFLIFDPPGDPLDEYRLDRERVARALARLPERERDIVRRRAEGESLSDIGDAYGFSRERARQLYERGLSMLREEVLGGD